MRLTTIASAALLLMAGTAGASTLEQSFDKTYEMRPGALLSLDNTNGAVIIRAANDQRVHVHAVKQVSSLMSSSLQGALDAVKIEITQPGGGVKIETRYPKQGDNFFSWLTGDHANASVTYTLDVPRTSNLQIETVNGHIEVHEVAGDLKLETTNGHIEVARCRGSLDAETTNGAIKAELLSVSNGHGLRLETTNGHINLSVPRTLVASIDAATTNGGISSELPVAATTTHRHTLRGTINGGGPEMKLRTTNGPISILALN